MVPEQKIKTKWVGKTKNYYISKGYTFTKMNDDLYVDVKDLPKKSNIYVKYICDYCNGKNQKEEKDKVKLYSNLTRDRKSINKDCCNNRECILTKRKEVLSLKPIPIGESLAEKYPSVINQWNYEKNDKTPFEYKSQSHAIVWWVCEKGHEWESRIDFHTRNKVEECPFCFGRVLTEENNLKSKFPKIASQWHPTLNEELTPDLVIYNSSKTVWWLGECGHEWDHPINYRTMQGLGCPFCSGNRVCLDNCFATLNPELAKEWHPTKNGELTPYDVTNKSSKRVWWKGRCRHEWKTKVSHRMGCPFCNESKGEKMIHEFLTSKNIKFFSQFEFDNLKGIGGNNLRFDFAIFNKENNLICLIEYDGKFHFGRVYRDDNYEIVVEHDKRKNMYCKNNNIPLFRIPFWEDKKLEYILNQILNYFHFINLSSLNEILIKKLYVNDLDWTFKKYSTK